MRNLQAMKTWLLRIMLKKTMAKEDQTVCENYVTVPLTNSQLQNRPLYFLHLSEKIIAEALRSGDVVG